MRSTVLQLPSLRAVAWCVAVAGLEIASSCSAIDERDPTISDGTEQQALPPLQPRPAGNGGSSAMQGSAMQGSAMQGASGNGAAPGTSRAGAGGEGQASGSGANGNPDGATPSGDCPAGDYARCTTPDSRPGACVQPGQCIEYCAVGVSLVGACLVQPG